MKDQAHSKKELSQYWGVSLTTIDKYLLEGMPSISKGSNGVSYTFDLDEVDRWRAQQRKPGAHAVGIDSHDLPDLLKRRPDFANGVRFTSEYAILAFYDGFFSGLGGYLLLNSYRIQGVTDEAAYKNFCSLAVMVNLAIRQWIVTDELDRRLRGLGSSVDDLWKLQNGRKQFTPTRPPSDMDVIEVPLPDSVSSIDEFLEFRQWAFDRFDEKDTE